ncbi:unnamed protein product [Orchesella dallaii]|uniref:Armadillo repeat-containing protein 4 n=1 Tax=Orchesella dallaii TaxID=48710 RepID=A0ABP1R395_9HEXA
MSSTDFNDSILQRDAFSSEEEEELKFSESEDDPKKLFRKESAYFKRQESKNPLPGIRKTSVIPAKRATLGTVSYQLSIASSDEESSSESEKEDIPDRKPSSPDLPPEYWQVQKLLKFIKAGNPTATIIALSSLRDSDLTDDVIQRGIKESGGIEVLLNILETDESTSKRAALMALRDITSNKKLCRLVFNMRGLETLIPCLDEPSKEIKLLAAEIISKICNIRKARRAMRKGEGINRLVDMLDTSESDWDVARCGAMALWSLAKSTKNKGAIRKAGAIPLLAKLVVAVDVSLVVPVVGILQECASDPTFRTAIRTEGLLSHFVNSLSSDCAELVQFSAKAIFMCAKDEEAREIVFNLGATEPLICIIQSPSLRENKPLLAAATGAIWKCSSVIFENGKSEEIILEDGMESTKETPTQGLVGLLVSLLEDQPEEILINTSGSLYNALRTDLNCYASIVKRADTTPKLISLLKRDNEALLVNTTRVVGELARDEEARTDMERLDGFRLVWSLLKHSSVRVQASAAKAIFPYVESSKTSAEMVRNYVGGLEALVHLLGSSDVEVRSAVAYAIGCIARNPDNLAIMSDHAVVQYLARLAPTPTAKDDELRECLATAIARCCPWKDNCSEFGKLKAVAPICGYLSSPSPKVHRAAAKALHALSADSRNCVTIHQCGVVPSLISMSGSLDEELRYAVAGIMSNIRKLALSAEKIRLL